jgi:hypothetical protein
MRLSLFLPTLILPLFIGCAGFGNTNTATETTTGAVIGGITGALIGEHNDDPLAGAIIGTTAGALLGNATGQVNDRIDAKIAASEQAYQEHAVTLNQILTMTQAGVDDAVIISRIETNGPAQTLTTDDIIFLSKSQVAPTVISAYQSPPTPPVAEIHADDIDANGPNYPFPIVPGPTAGFRIDLGFGN